MLMVLERNCVSGGGEEYVQIAQCPAIPIRLVLRRQCQIMGV